MMKYRLKDKELQRKLDDITNGGFSEVLKKGIPPTFFAEEFLFLGAGSIRVRLFESAFEEVPEYDPNKWNAFPDVTPPEHELLRVKIYDAEKDFYYFKGTAFWNGRKWLKFRGVRIGGSDKAQLFFRSFEDKEE